MLSATRSASSCVRTRQLRLLPEISIVRCFAKKPAAAAAPGLESTRKRLPAETDPVKLATYCCGSNIRQEGEDVKLGKDEDYPEWLWKIHLGRPKSPEELEKHTEEYWEALHRDALYHQNKLLSGKNKEKLRINEKDKFAKLEGIVHRALAFKFYDPGTSVDEWKRRRFRKYGPYGVYPENHYLSRFHQPSKKPAEEVIQIVAGNR